MPRAPWSHHLLAALARAAAWTLRILPARVAYGLGDVLAFVLVHPLVVYLDKKSAKKGRGVVRNLRIAFREEAKDPAFVRRMMRGYARHMCASMIDLCRLPLISERTTGKYIADNESWRVLRATYAEDNGAIGATGHIGAMEVAGHGASVIGVGPLHSIMRPAGISPINRLLVDLRTSHGQVLITKWGAIREARKLLLQKKQVAFVLDENETRAKSAVFVPFLGAMGATNTSVALLHLRTGCPITVGTMHREGPMRFRFHTWDVIRYEPTDDTDADVRAICERINRGFSAAIRAYPEQWFWGMRRWASRPEGEELGADGLPPEVPGAREAEEELARRITSLP